MFSALLHGPNFFELVVLLGMFSAPTFLVAGFLQILALRRRSVQMPWPKVFGVLLVTVLISIIGTVLFVNSPLDRYSGFEPHLFYLPAVCSAAVVFTIATLWAMRARAAPTWAHVLYFGLGGVFGYLIILAYLFLRPPRDLFAALLVGFGVSILMGLFAAAFGDRLFRKWFA